MIKDRKFRIPRIWSNQQLKSIAHLFQGKVANVSGWQDSDKQGRRYRDYFVNASEYWITNYKTEARGYQGNLGNEVFLDLEASLPSGLKDRFDVVFNHTSLEHIYDCRKAFANLCQMSKDVVIVIVPFLQEQHGDYGDYWRFTPLALLKMYEENGLRLTYLSFNDASNDSVYIFAVGVRNSDKWASLSGMQGNRIDSINATKIGTRIIKNNSLYYVFFNVRGILNQLIKKQ